MHYVGLLAPIAFVVSVVLFTELGKELFDQGHSNLICGS